eukprot:m.47746 g.47746  ORF g.47746 m.47746 type:complete len:368 (-) comp20564_c0_seq1:42-1145(-)
MKRSQAIFQGWKTLTFRQMATSSKALQQKRYQDPFVDFKPRHGETHLGETIGPDQYGITSATHVLVGIPEDIGVRANGGRGGASYTPNMVFKALGNFQSNSFFDGIQIGWGGNVNVDEYQHKSEDLSYPEDETQLRNLTAMVDNAVIDHLRPLFEAGKIPIIVGGGHNNAYGALYAASMGLQSVINAINLDPHPDCRAMEGRHSGNGFLYAHEHKCLDRYAVLGMFETSINESSLSKLKHTPGWMFESFESFAVRDDTTFAEARDRCLEHVGGNNRLFGLEIDTDGIINCPSSAQTATGWTWNDARKLAYKAAQMNGCSYLHLAEASIINAAPHDQPSIAKAMAHVIVDFVRGHNDGKCTKNEASKL